MNRRQACSGLVRPGGIKPSQTPSGLIISGRNLRMHDGQDVLAQGDPNADSVGSVALTPSGGLKLFLSSAVLVLVSIQGRS